MSDMGITPGDQVIDLDLSGIEAARPWMPVPTDAYALQITDASVVPTKKGGKMIKINSRICEGTLDGQSIGIDNLVIPDRERQPEDAYKTTASFFKAKIEAIMGQPYAGKLNVKEMVGKKFKGIVTLKDDPGYGPQNEITSFLPWSADISALRGKMAAPMAPRAPQNGGGATAPAEPSRFKI